MKCNNGKNIYYNTQVFDLHTFDNKKKKKCHELY